MTQYQHHLQWIDAQHETMCRLVAEWGDINSGSGNVAGLRRMADAILPRLTELAPHARRQDLPPRTVIDDRGELRELAAAPALHAVRSPTHARGRVLLVIHFDTVYGPSDPFQHVRRIDAQTLNGPGVADAKGGIIVLLTALQAFMRSPWADRLGWEVLLNPDEELGSPSSATCLQEVARRNDLGLVFEPAMPDGGLVSTRNGSSSFALVVRGKSAHVGRDFASGRNAVHALAQLIVEAVAIPDELPGVILNVGKIEGGGPTNVVPDLAIARLNLRADNAAAQSEARARLESLVEKLGQRDGIRATLHETSSCPPKPLDDTTRRLLESVAACGRELGLPAIEFHPSGGVSDANRLVAAGLPTLDTLGVRGGNLHSHDEFIRLDSLTERAKLTALMLMKLASGELTVPLRSDARRREEHPR